MEENSATFADIVRKKKKKDPSQVKEVLRRYHGEVGKDVQGLADLCERDSKVSSDMKVLLMAKVVSISLRDEYVAILNDDFNTSDIKKVLEALLEQLAEKFDFTDYFELVKKITKSTAYNNIKDVLSEFPRMYETSVNPTEFFVSDACLKKCKIPSELKVLLMAKLITRSPKEYYLEVLNSDFNRDDIKKVLQQLDATTLQKLHEVVKKDEKYKKIESVLNTEKNKKENHVRVPRK